MQLIDVVIYTEVTTAWSPVTATHLGFYVNGMLSLPGDIEKLVNIFEVNSETLQINYEAFLADIEEYGLFTYEDFEQLIPEHIFEAFGVKYFKVAMGKGLLDMDTVYNLIARYSEFF